MTAYHWFGAVVVAVLAMATIVADLRDRRRPRPVSRQRIERLSIVDRAMPE